MKTQARPAPGRPRMRGAGPSGLRLTMLLSLLLQAALLAGCAGGGKGAAVRDMSRLDVLTNFTLALSKRDFPAAAAMMAPEERARFVDGRGRILPEYQERLRAMRLTTLVNNPFIGIEEAGIRGIFDALPVIDQAPAGESDILAGPALPAEPPPTSADAAVEERDRELRLLAEALFKSVQARKWDRALGLLNRKEREVFLRSDGKIKDEARKRLAAIDTSSWEALTLEDGKLTGVVLIIPAHAPGAPLTSSK